MLVDEFRQCVYLTNRCASFNYIHILSVTLLHFFLSSYVVIFQILHVLMHKTPYSISLFDQEQRYSQRLHCPRIWHWKIAGKSTCGCSEAFHWEDTQIAAATMGSNDLVVGEDHLMGPSCQRYDRQTGR